MIAEGLSRRPEFREQVDGDYVQLIYMTSPLHDIGKVGIPDHILLKAGRLTREEFEIMKQHTVIGGMTLDAAAHAHPEASFLSMARDIAWTHHERFDGSGYPDAAWPALDIPLSGRIVAVADVYDALTTKRVYKPAFTHAKAREILLDGSGTHFDPLLVKAFLQDEERVLQIKETLDTRPWRCSVLRLWTSPS